MSSQPELKRILSPIMVWGLGVGYVISGNYFGWNLGLEQGGTLGMAIALFFIIILYITFTLSYTELACAIPKSGGAFDYAKPALGDDAAFITGMAQNLEFIFATPAIAFAIGNYFNILLPNLSVTLIAILAYIFFFLINVAGVKIAAMFELTVTALAVAAVIFFAGISSPHFDVVNLRQNEFPHGWSGVFAATPFAIWFFLGIEGVANLAEETINPKRTIMLGFGSAIFTLVVLCLITFTTSIGIAGWEAIVFKPDGATSDSPLPLAMAHIVDRHQWQYQLLVAVGLLGLVASFHGLMLAGGRSMLEFGRVSYAPGFLGKIHPRFQTPANALFVNIIIGIAVLLTGKTGEIITISVFGALTLYVLSMISLLVLRRKEPHLDRPFRVPLYPFFPVIALTIAVASLGAMIFYNRNLALIYFLILGVSYVAFKITKKL